MVELDDTWRMPAHGWLIPEMTEDQKAQAEADRLELDRLRRRVHDLFFRGNN